MLEEGAPVNIIHWDERGMVQIVKGTIAHIHRYEDGHVHYVLCPMREERDGDKAKRPSPEPVGAHA